MKSKLASLVKNKFVQGGSLFMLANFIASAINYIFNSLSAKALGPAQYGELVALFSYVAILVIPISIGSVMLVRRLGTAGKQRDIVARVIEKWFYSRLSRLSPLLIPYFLLLPFIPAMTKLNPESSVFLLIIMILTLFSSIYNGILQGLQLFGALSFSLVLVAILKLISAILVYYNVGDITTIYIFFTVGFFSPIILAKLKLHRIAVPKNYPYKLDKKVREVILRHESILTIFSLLAISVINYVDLIYVKRFFDAEQVGIFASWSLFAKLILYIAGPLNGIFFIFFSDSTRVKNSSKYMRLNMLLYFCLGVMFYLFYDIAGKDLINIAFNEKYLSIVPYINKAAIYGSAYTALVFLNNYFIAKQSKYASLIMYGTPIYMITLYIFGRSLERVIDINMYFTLILLAVYIIATISERKSSTTS